MKNGFRFVCLFGLLACCAGTGADEEKGFRPLFNEKDLSEWYGNDPHQTRKAKDPAASLQEQAEAFQRHWRVENGELVNDGLGPYATTRQEYGDFEFKLEFRISEGSDSGIYLRGNPQVQIWDTREEGGKWKHGAEKGSGGLWNNGNLGGRWPKVHADRPIGEWNEMRIRLIGSRVWIWLNGEQTVDGVLMKNYWERKSVVPLPPRGPIHLQTHGGETRWRNLLIREIGSEEANRLLRGIDDDGFVSVFNGKDMDGWQGATGSYAVKDGAIRSQGSGVLYSGERYADFDWKLEFRLPPGGNNGLAIRYPGQGDPAYSGMCELQVLDDSAPQYAELDARQYHGSVYGKVAARRGFLRSPGEWNFQTVRTQGSRVTVELNGNRIVDADLSTVTEFMKPKFKNHLPQDGFIGLAGHGHGVAFRELWVRRL